MAAQTNGKQIEPVWLMEGEFIISVPAAEGFGLRAGAASEDAHAAGLEELNRLHEEHRNISLNIKDDAAEQAVPETIAGSVTQAVVGSEQEKPNDSNAGRSHSTC